MTERVNALDVVDLTAGGDFAMLKVGIAARGLPAGPLRIA